MLDYTINEAQSSFFLIMPKMSKKYKSFESTKIRKHRDTYNLAIVDNYEKIYIE